MNGIDIKDRNVITIYCKLEDVNLDIENKAHIEFSGTVQISKRIPIITDIVKLLRELTGKDIILVIKEMG